MHRTTIIVLVFVMHLRLQRSFVVLELFESFVTSRVVEQVLARLVHGQSDVFDVVAPVGPDSADDGVLRHADVRDLVDGDVQEVADNATQKSLVRDNQIGFVLETFDADQRVQDPFTTVQVRFSCK